jgi:peptidoglycan/LPS O-acetylase OafA/YrhL
MLQASGLEQHFSFNSPSWSLSIEMLCYLLFFVVARYANGRICIVSGAILGIAVLAQLSSTTGILTVALARGLIGFFVGVLVRRNLAWFMRRDAVLLAAATIAATITPPTLGWRWHLNAGSQFALAAFPLLLVLSLRGPIPALLRRSPAQILGKLSFSIYLIHVPMMLLLLALNDGQTLAVGTLPWLIPIFLCTCLSLSWLSYHRFEQPMRRAVNRLATANPLATPISGRTAKQAARPSIP